MYGAVVISYDGGSDTAVVRLVGSLSGVLSGVPVALHVTAGDMLADARVLVAVLDPTNKEEMVVVGVY